VADLSAPAGTLFLDSGGVSAIAEGSGLARAAIERARRDGWTVAIAAPVLAEVHTGRRDHAHIDRVVNAVDRVVPTTADRARQAGELRSMAGVRDVVDAIVVADAVAAPPALVMTSDPDDIGRLIDASGAGARVRVLAV
jgi:hypothetical protein